MWSPGYKGAAAAALDAARARVAVAQGDWAAATAHLQLGVVDEFSGGYTEPPRQYQPLRQCLGWVLLQQGRLREAEQVTRGGLTCQVDLPFWW